MSPNIAGFPKKIYFALSFVAKSGKVPLLENRHKPHKFPILKKSKKKPPQKEIYSVWRQVPKYLSKHFLKFFF
jgi:hypothetical protein